MLKSGRVLRHRRESILGVHDCQRSVLLEGSRVIAKLVQQTAESPDITWKSHRKTQHWLYHLWTPILQGCMPVQIHSKRVSFKLCLRRSVSRESRGAKVA